MQDSTNHMDSFAEPSQFSDSLMSFGGSAGARSLLSSFNDSGVTRFVAPYNFLHNEHIFAFGSQHSTSPSSAWLPNSGFRLGPDAGQSPPNVDCPFTQERCQDPGVFGSTLEAENSFATFLATSDGLVDSNNNASQSVNSSDNLRGALVDNFTLYNATFNPSIGHVMPQTFWSCSDGPASLPLNGVDTPIGTSAIHWGQSNGVSGVPKDNAFESWGFQDHLVRELHWGTSPHVSGTTFMNGGIAPVTNGFQFANAGDIGHELAFPMHPHEATAMQGPPDGTNMWDDTGLDNASPHDGQVSAPFSMADRLQSPAVLPCRYPTCNKTFKREGDRSRHEQSIHIKSPGLHLCQIADCQKSHGKGYSRPDKVTEHLWKKHAHLGFTKA